MKFLFIVGVFLVVPLFFTSNAYAVAPSATNLSAAETYTEDVSLNLIDIVATDIDSSVITATLTLSNSSVGALNTATSGATTSTYNAGTGVWTASGPIADVNTLLAGVTFVPAANVNSNFTVATSVSDGAESVSGTKTFTGTAVNDAPTATNLSAAETYTEDTTLNLIDIVASDVDSATVTVTLTVSTLAAGSLSTATSGAVTSTYSAGVWTASGAVSSVNTLLAGVIFTPSSDYNSSFTIATSVSDGIYSATGTKVVTGTAVNDAPVLDAVRTPTFTSIASGAGAPSGAVGTSVSDLIDATTPAGGLDNVVDVDSSPLYGIAITAKHANLTCYYSTSGGAVWISIGSVSTSTARLLAAGASNRIYCQPDIGLSGTVAAITFRAWDRTSGSDGGTADTTSSGGTTAFSSVTDTANLTITGSNTAPIAVDDSNNMDEDDGGQSQAVLGNDIDVDNDTLTIISVTSPNHGGSVQILFDIYVGYIPGPDYCGIETYEYTVSDGNGGTDTATVVNDITCINDLPTVSADTGDTYELDTTTDLTDIVVSDVDDATLTVTLTLSNASAGSLNTGVSGAVTSTYNGGTGVWTASGAVADVNTLLADLVFTPTLGFDDNFGITILVEDADGATTSGSRTMNFYAPDVTPPDTIITSQDAAGVAAAIAIFEFESDEQSATFECQIDNGTFDPCTSPYMTSQLTVGQHAFAVRAVDIANNTDASPAEVSWEIALGADLVSVSPVDDAASVSATTQIVYTFAQSIPQYIADRVSISSSPCNIVCPVLSGVWSDNNTVITFTKDSAFGFDTEYTVELALNNGLITDTIVEHSFTIESAPVVVSVGGGIVPIEFLRGMTPSVGNTTVATTPSAPSAITFTRTLRRGSDSEDVVALQRYLRSKGFEVVPAGQETTYFGPKTQKTLAAFQKSVGIVPASGFFGPITMAYVNSHQ